MLKVIFEDKRVSITDRKSLRSSFVLELFENF